MNELFNKNVMAYQGNDSINHTAAFGHNADCSSFCTLEPVVKSEDLNDPLGVFFDDTESQIDENSPISEENNSNDQTSWDTVLSDVPMQSDDFITKELLIKDLDAEEDDTVSLEDDSVSLEDDSVSFDDDTISFEDDTVTFEDQIDSLEKEMDSTTNGSEENKERKSFILSLITLPDSVQDFKENTKKWSFKGDKNTIKISLIDFTSLQSSLITIGKIAALIFCIKKIKKNKDE